MDAATIGKKLQQSYPQYAKIDPAVLGQKYIQKYGSAVEGVSSGKIKITDIPEAQRVAVSIGMEGPAGKNDPAEIDAVNNLIKTLEQRYQAGGGGDTNLGPLTRILGAVKSAGAAAGLNPEAQLYKKEKAGFAATLKKLSGDTGVLTDQDYERLAGLLPGLGSTGAEATGAFEDLRKQVGAKYGKAEETTYKSKSGTGATGNDLIDMLLGTSINVAKDVGTAAGQKSVAGVQGSQLKALEGARKLEKLANETTDPEEKARLLKLANQSREVVGSEANTAASQYSKDIDRGYIDRGLSTGAQIASVAELPAMLKGALNITKSAPKAVGKIFSQKAGQELRNEAVETATKAGKKVETKPIIEKIAQWGVDAKKANPTATARIDKFVNGTIEQLGDAGMNPDDAFTLWDNASKGFSAAGTKGASMEASYHRAIRDAIRGELDKAAPGFEKGTQMIKEGLQRTKAAKKFGNIAAGGAVGGLTFLALNKLLSGLGINTKQ